jgi:hypothetical protein
VHSDFPNTLCVCVCVCVCIEIITQYTNVQDYNNRLFDFIHIKLTCTLAVPRNTVAASSKIKKTEDSQGFPERQSTGNFSSSPSISEFLSVLFTTFNLL